MHSAQQCRFYCSPIPFSETFYWIDRIDRSAKIEKNYFSYCLRMYLFPAKRAIFQAWLFPEIRKYTLLPHRDWDGFSYSFSSIRDSWCSLLSLHILSDSLSFQCSLEATQRLSRTTVYVKEKVFASSRNFLQFQQFFNCTKIWSWITIGLLMRLINSLTLIPKVTNKTIKSLRQVRSVFYAEHALQLDCHRWKSSISSSPRDEMMKSWLYTPYCPPLVKIATVYAFWRCFSELLWTVHTYARTKTHVTSCCAFSARYLLLCESHP